MKNIFLVFMALITTSVNAQTKVISFKSHSGDMNNFIFKETGNFGLDERIFSPSFNPDTIVRISDSMYVFINGQGKDTINNIPGLIPEEHDLSLNDIKKRFPRTILIGFEENEKGNDVKRKNKNKSVFLIDLNRNKNFPTFLFLLSVTVLTFLLWQLNIKKKKTFA